MEASLTWRAACTGATLTAGRPCLAAESGLSRCATPVMPCVSHVLQLWNLCSHYLPYAVGGGYVLAGALVQHIADNGHMLQHYNSEVMLMQCGDQSSP